MIVGKRRKTPNREASLDSSSGSFVLRRALLPSRVWETNPWTEKRSQKSSPESTRVSQVRANLLKTKLGVREALRAFFFLSFWQVNFWGPRLQPWRFPSLSIFFPLQISWVHKAFFHHPFEHNSKSKARVREDMATRGSRSLLVLSLESVAVSRWWSGGRTVGCASHTYSSGFWTHIISFQTEHARGGDCEMEKGKVNV